jgi:hypothetical protein
MLKISSRKIAFFIASSHLRKKESFTVAFFPENDKAIFFYAFQKSATRNTLKNKPKESKDGKQEDQIKPNHLDHQLKNKEKRDLTIFQTAKQIRHITTKAKIEEVASMAVKPFKKLKFCKASNLPPNALTNSEEKELTTLSIGLVAFGVH